MERGLSGMKNGPMRAAFNSWTDKAFGEPDPALRALAHFANGELSKASSRGWRPLPSGSSC